MVVTVTAKTLNAYSKFSSKNLAKTSNLRLERRQKEECNSWT